MLSQKPWRVEAVLQFCVALFACYCSGIVLISVLGKTGLKAFQLPNGFGVTMIATFSFQGMALVLAPFFLRRHQLAWREAFGFNGPRVKRALIFAVLTIAIVLPLVLRLDGALTRIAEWMGWHPDPQVAVQTAMGAKTRWERAYFGLFAIVVAPAAEEFIFRGVLYPFIKQLGWPRVACIGVSFLFAAIHVDLIRFLPLFVLALALTWLYEETDNLLAPITAHSVFNAVNFALLLILKI